MSSTEDAVNAEARLKAREGEADKDGQQSVKSNMQVKVNEKVLSSIWKIPKVIRKTIHLNSLKLFNRLIILANRDMTISTSLEYEVAPFPLSFSEQR